MTKTQYIKKIIINNWMFIILFTCFFVYLRISPMMYDGWAGADYYNREGGLIQWIRYMHSFYTYINGRIASNFFCGILESFPSEIVLDFSNALVMTLICWSLCEIFRIREINKKLLTVVLYYALIIFIPEDMRTYVIQIANTAYVPPILFGMLFYLAGRKYMEQPNSAPQWILWVMCILAFCIGTWMEHYAVGFGVVLGISLLYITYRDRNIYWYLWIATAVVFFSGVLMLLAPSLRMNRTIISEEVKVITMFLNNIKSLYKYLLRDNICVLVIFFALLAFVEVQHGWKKSVFRKVIFILDTLLAAWFVVVYLNDYIISSPMLTKYINRIYFGIVNNTVLSIVTIIFMITLTVSSLLICKGCKPLLLFASVVVFSLLPLCFTPQISARVTFIGFFMQLCICIGLLSEIKLSKSGWRKAVSIGIICLGILAIDQEILLCRRIDKITTQRQQIINEAVLEQKMGKWNYEKDLLRLPVYQEGDVFERGVTSEGTFHYPSFLSRYGLASKTRVLFTNSYYYNVSVEQSGSFVSFRVDSILRLEENYKFYYKFLSKDGKEIFNSVTVVDDTWKVDCPIGEYYVQTYLCDIDEDGKTVKSMELIDQPISLTIKGYHVGLEQSGSTVTLYVDNIPKDGYKLYYIFLNSSGKEVFNSITAVDDTWTVECPEGEYTVQTFLCNMGNDGKTVESMKLINDSLHLNV